MKEFRKLKSLDEIPNVKVGEIIGVGQLVSETIPAVCILNDGKEISLLGNIDNKMISKYDIKINEVTALYQDGSLFTEMKLGKNFNVIFEGDKGYGQGKDLLYKAGLWEGVTQ